MRSFLTAIEHSMFLVEIRSDLYNRRLNNLDTLVNLKRSEKIKIKISSDTVISKCVILYAETYAYYPLTRQMRPQSMLDALH